MKSSLKYSTYQTTEEEKIKMYVYNDNKPGYTVIDVRSPESLYVTINGKTIYIELSEATENKFYTSKF